MRKAPQKVLKKIEAFLNERRTSKGGWAPVTDKDMEQLHAVMYALTEAKWGPDEDGDRPLNYILIDRTKFWPMSYRPILYAHDDCPPEERVEALRQLMSNIQISAKDVDKHLHIDEMMEQYKKK